MRAFWFYAEFMKQARHITFDIITLFPEVLRPYCGVSILRRAQEKKLVTFAFYNPRDFAERRSRRTGGIPTSLSNVRKGASGHRVVDGSPYGGGAGMVLKAEPVLAAVAEAMGGKGKGVPRTKAKVIILSAKGKQFSQNMANDWAKKYERIVLVAGRYEGVDERVRIALKAEEVSIGPYVMTDGDVAAMAVVSAVARLVPGVIRLESLEEESHVRAPVVRGADGSGGGLEYPHYTRPEAFIWKGKTYRVPKVLLSGNHAEINAWRSGKSRRARG